MVNRAASVALLLLMAAGMSGCGADQQDPEIATAGGTPSAAASADVVAEYLEAQRAWVTCLRKEGLQVSDPDAKGEVDFNLSSWKDKTDPKFIQAQQKCRGLTRPRPEELNDDPELTPEQIEANRRYSKCMQDNGAPDFPDPRPDGYLGDGEWDSFSDGARRAFKQCGHIVGEPSVAPSARG